jgi:hypothetical protein
VKHVFPLIGGVVAVLALTSHWFARRAHLSHGKEYIAAAAIVAVFTVIGILAAHGGKEKPTAQPRAGYPYGNPRR